MIETLRICDLAIVEEAELDFGPGLNVLTGETGAGKSIVLGALALLSGGRARADSVREGAERAQVEAVFRTEALPELEAALEAMGLRDGDGDADAPHELIVQRSLSRTGRSRVRIGGQLVPLAALGELLSGRIEISSQHSSQALLRPEAHARMLDEAGGHGALRDDVARGVARLRALDEERAALRAAAEERARREDFLRFQVDEIDAVGLGIDELAQLESLHRRLAHVDRLREEGGLAVAALSGDAAGEGEGGLDLLARARRAALALAQTDPALAPLAERLHAAEDEVRDVAADLERYVDRLEGDPGRLAQVEERLAQIDRLRRKYGEDAAAILAHRDAVARELEGLVGADARIAALEQERETLAQALAADAAKLTRARSRAARALARRVEAPLRELALPEARFAVALEPLTPPEGLPCAAHGAESVEFRFAAAAGSEPRPLQRVASGGELSRIFLALKNALRGAGRGMVLVFDEVDTGIGGRVAERVGRNLAELAREHQVLCITHHPQIAALADRHLCVRKGAQGRGVVIEGVEGRARVEEIARMAGGEEISDATRRHAEALLRGAAAQG